MHVYLIACVSLTLVFTITYINCALELRMPMADNCETNVLVKQFSLNFFVLRTQAILIVSEKFTRACFFQIALETILLPTY